MTTVAFQITSRTIVYSIVYSGADQRKHQSSASLAFVRRIHRGRWIPRTKGQLRGKCFHLMTSSCNARHGVLDSGDLITSNHGLSTLDVQWVAQISSESRFWLDNRLFNSLSIWNVSAPLIRWHHLNLFHTWIYFIGKYLRVCSSHGLFLVLPQPMRDNVTM